MKTGKVSRVKVSYDKGLANQVAPESCVDRSNPVGEALTREPAGRVLSRETRNNTGAPTCSDYTEGNTVPNVSWTTSLARVRDRLCEVKDPAHAGKHLTQESGDPGNARNGRSGPRREGLGRKPTMNGLRKSDSCIVPTKSPNKAERRRRRWREGDWREAIHCVATYPDTEPGQVGSKCYRMNTLLVERYDRLQEPDAVIPLVRICEGGAP